MHIRGAHHNFGAAPKPSEIPSSTSLNPNPTNHTLLLQIPPPTYLLYMYVELMFNFLEEAGLISSTLIYHSIGSYTTSTCQVSVLVYSFQPHIYLLAHFTLIHTHIHKLLYIAIAGSSLPRIHKLVMYEHTHESLLIWYVGCY